MTRTGVPESRERAAAGGRGEQRSTIVVALVTVLAGATVGLISVTSYQRPIPMIWALPVVVALVALSRAVPTDKWTGRNRVSYNWAEAAFVVGLVLLPHPFLLLATGAGVLLACLVRQIEFRKTLFNTSAGILSTGAAFAVATRTPLPDPTVSTVSGIATLVVAALTYSVANNLLLSAVLSASEGRPVVGALVRTAGLPQLVFAGQVAVALVIVALAQWRTEALLLLPVAVAALQYAHISRLELQAQDRAARELEDATRELNRLDETGVLDVLTRHAARLGRPAPVEIALIGETGDQQVFRGGGAGLADHADDVPVPRAGAMVRVPLTAGEQHLGELRLHVDRTVQLGDAELRSLSTLAAAAGVAVLNARQHARALHDADHDALTGLANRRALLARTGRCLEAPGGRAALLLLDLDRFKDINDTLGHAEGDELLCQVAERLRQAVAHDPGPAYGLPGRHLVARLGGDEFAVLLPDHDAESAARVAQRVHRALSAPAVAGGITVSVGGSIGVALSDPGPGADRRVPDADTEGATSTLLRRADVAMYEAKAAGGGVRHYDPARDPNSMERLTLGPALRTALDVTDTVTDPDTGEGSIVVLFQPQVALDTDRPAGVEALARWHHPRFGVVLPAVFLPVAERHGLRTALTMRVLDQALAARVRWAADERHRDVPVAVNVDGGTLFDPELPDLIARQLDRHGVRPGHLVVEVPEVAVRKEVEEVAAAFGRLHGLGVRLSLDGFGTGAAPLTLLARVPLDQISLDRSLIARMLSDRVTATIVRGGIDLAHTLGLRVVAEGVERPDQARWLREAGCDLVQGFLYARPVPVEELAAALDAAGSVAPTPRGGQVIPLRRPPRSTLG